MPFQSPSDIFFLSGSDFQLQNKGRVTLNLELHFLTGERSNFEWRSDNLSPSH